MKKQKDEQDILTVLGKRNTLDVWNMSTPTVLAPSELLTQCHQWGPTAAMTYLYLEQHCFIEGKLCRIDWRDMFTQLGQSVDLTARRNGGVNALFRLKQFRAVSFGVTDSPGQVLLHADQSDPHISTLNKKQERNRAA